MITKNNVQLNDFYIIPYGIPSPPFGNFRSLIATRITEINNDYFVYMNHGMGVEGEFYFNPEDDDIEKDEELMCEGIVVGEKFRPTLEACFGGEDFHKSLELLED